jgi:phosphoserine aminotransferase
VIDQSRSLLGIPDDYRLAIVPASDSGALEMALWSLLGERGVDVLAWESFGQGWLTDVQKQLALDDLRAITADYGDLPDLAQADFDRDVVFTWNGTTSGVRVPNADWIPEQREGLAICDGGEAAHGMLALSPRAVERLETFVPPRPLPKIFRMTKNGKLIEALFQGATINTPSMLAVEDALDALRWAEEVGGLPALIARSEANLGCLTDWVARTAWVDFLAKAPETRSCTSICLQIVDPWFLEQSQEERAAAAKKIGSLLDSEGVAFDINSYKDAPPGLRIWGGATVETDDIRALLPWLDWAFARIKAG